MADVSKLNVFGTEYDIKDATARSGISDLNTEVDNKVDKVTGKGLSTEDYTSDEKTKLAGISAGAQVNTVTGVKGNSESSYRTGDINITKANIGLGNVDNTSDTDKPVSTAQQTALNAKQAAKITATATLASGAKSWTWNNTNVTASNTVICTPAPASYAQWTDNRVRCSKQEAGKLTFTGDTNTTAAITVNVLIFN